MIRGIVNSALEATLPLQVVGPHGSSLQTAVIDTGYNGTLSLSLASISNLALPQRASRSVALGDASSHIMDFYEAEVVWDGQQRTITVLCVEGDPLIGTGLLNGYKMEADFVVGGPVRIVAVP